MIKIHIRYVSACRDASGYAAAARQYISALAKSSKVDLSLRIASFEHSKVQHTSFEGQVNGLIEKQNNPKIQICHLTPENFPSYRANGIYNIAYTAWETEKLPDGWPALLNSMDEVWVPSKWNQEVFKSSGVIKPIYVIPHIIDPPAVFNDAEISMPTLEQDAYVFYSIFQWIERKNPQALLKAYFTEFTSQDSVYLVLKTYRIDCSPAERQAIKADLDMIKKSLNLAYYPPIIFFGDLFTRDQILALHHKCDCYVSMQRGEGFGIPLAEAMSHGKPVVTTGYGGCLEFMNPSNSFLVPAQRTPVSGMIFQNYNAHMVWGDPSIMEARKLMRYCYENRGNAKDIGAKASQDIRKDYNENTIQKLIVNRLEQIQGELNG